MCFVDERLLMRRNAGRRLSPLLRTNALLGSVPAHTAGAGFFA